MVSVLNKLPVFSTIPVVSGILKEMEEGPSSNVLVFRPNPKNGIKFGNCKKQESTYLENWNLYNDRLQGEIVFSTKYIPKVVNNPEQLSNIIWYGNEMDLYARAILHSSIKNYPVAIDKSSGNPIYINDLKKHYIELIWSITINGLPVVNNNLKNSFFTVDVSDLTVDSDGMKYHDQAQTLDLKLILKDFPNAYDHANRTHNLFTMELLRHGVGIHVVDVTLTMAAGYKGTGTPVEPVFGVPQSHPLAKGRFLINVPGNIPLINPSPIPVIEQKYSEDINILLKRFEETNFFKTHTHKVHPLSIAVTKDWEPMDFYFTILGERKCKGWGIHLKAYGYCSPQHGHDSEKIVISSYIICNNILGPGYANGFGTMDLSIMTQYFSTKIVPDSDLLKVPNRCPIELRKWMPSLQPINNNTFGYNLIKPKTLNLPECKITLDINGIEIDLGGNKSFKITPLPEYSNHKLPHSQMFKKTARVVKLGFNRYIGGITWSERNLTMDGSTITWNAPPNGTTQLTNEFSVRLVGNKNSVKRTDAHPGGNNIYYDYAIGRDNCIEISSPKISYYIQFKSLNEALDWVQSIDYNIRCLQNPINNTEQIKNIIFSTAKSLNINTKSLESINWSSTLDSLYYQ